MKVYQDLLRNVLEHGVWQGNRTNHDAKFIPSAAMTFDLNDGFPIVTTRKAYYKQSFGEIIGFLRGVQSAADFRALGCNFWNSDANENATWLDSHWRKGKDDCGLIYGATWRNREVIMHSLSAEESEALCEKGYLLESTNGAISYYTKKIDQLRECVDKIINKPEDRRIIMHAWFPELFPKMALPPCHTLYEFVPDARRKVLHMTLFQRSCDGYLGIPANIVGGALLLSLIAKACGYKPGTFSHHMTNFHLYENAIANVKVQIQREPLTLPALRINVEPGHPITTSSAIEFLESIEPEDISLEGYQHHEALPRVEMAQEKK